VCIYVYIYWRREKRGMPTTFAVTHFIYARSVSEMNGRSGEKPLAVDTLAPRKNTKPGLSEQTICALHSPPAL
jgi:hypothetical protein